MRLVRFCVIAIAVLGATAGCAFAADVRSELGSIQVNSGGSVIDRIERCGIYIHSISGPVTIVISPITSSSARCALPV